MAARKGEDAEKHVLEHSVTSPFTLYPTGIGIVGAVAAGLFGLNPVTGVVALGGIGLGAANFGVNYFFRREYLKQEYFRIVFDELEKKRQEALEHLRESLSELEASGSQSLRHFAEQGRSQYHMVDERFDTVQNLLSRKLHEGELTHGRYLQASEEVFLAVLDNLERAVSLVKSAGAIDERYIADRIEKLERLGSPSDADRREHKTLLERLELSRNQHEKINDLLTHNEEAITKLDLLNASLADMPIVKGRSSRELEMAIEEMEDLAARVSRYQ